MKKLIIPILILGLTLGGYAYADIATFYSEAGDGNIRSTEDGAEGWNVAHDAITGDATDYASESDNASSGTYSDGDYYIFRLFLPFDTSALPDNATVASSTLYFYSASVYSDDPDENDFVRLVQTTQNTTSTLFNALFDNCGSVNNPVAGATDLDLDNTTSGYNAWRLNETGLSWISLNSPTYLGIREGHDVVDDPFYNSTSDLNSLSIYLSEYADTSRDPYLTVEYTVPETPSLSPELKIKNGTLNIKNGTLIIK